MEGDRVQLQSDREKSGRGRAVVQEREMPHCRSLPASLHGCHENHLFVIVPFLSYTLSGFLPFPSL